MRYSNTGAIIVLILLSGGSFSMGTFHIEENIQTKTSNYPHPTEIENGRFEEIRITFEISSMLELGGTVFNLPNSIGENVSFVFDVYGTEVPSENTHIIRAYTSPDIGDVLEMFSGTVDEMIFFNSSIFDETTVVIHSLQAENLVNASFYPHSDKITLEIIDGAPLRVKSSVRHIAEVNLSRHVVDIITTDSGGFVIHTGYNQNNRIDDPNCFQNEVEESVSLIVRLDRNGTCMWAHRLSNIVVDEIEVFGEEVALLGHGYASTEEMDLDPECPDQQQRNYPCRSGGYILGNEILNTEQFLVRIGHNGVFNSYISLLDIQTLTIKNTFQDLDMSLILSEDGAYIFGANGNIFGCTSQILKLLWNSSIGYCSHTDLGYYYYYEERGEYPAPRTLVTPNGSMILFMDHFPQAWNSQGGPAIFVLNNTTGEIMHSMVYEEYEDGSKEPFFWNEYERDAGFYDFERVIGSFDAGSLKYRMASRMSHTETFFCNPSEYYGYDHAGYFGDMIALSDNEILFYAEFWEDPRARESASNADCFKGIVIMNITTGDFYVWDASSLTDLTSPLAGPHHGPQAGMINLPNGELCMVPGLASLRFYNSNLDDRLEDVWSAYGSYSLGFITVSKISITCFTEDFSFSWGVDVPLDEPEFTEGNSDITFQLIGSGESIVLATTKTQVGEGYGPLILEALIPPWETDSDADRILDVNDWCLGTSAGDEIDSFGCSWSQRDDDSDNWSNGDEVDCGTGADDAQDIPEDTDGDGECDLVDLDDDGDDAPDNLDLFPLDATEAADFDLDGVGDNADPDDDNDGWSDEDEISCYTDYLDSSSFPEDRDSDGECDTAQIDDTAPGSSQSYCGDDSVKAYLDSEGCTVVFHDISETGKKYSSISGVDSVSRGSNPTTQMAITPDGGVLAVLDDKSLLTLHFLDDGTSEWSILSDDHYLGILPDTGRIAIISGSECVDAILKTPCVAGWANGHESPGNEHFWSGHVYFSEEYTPCKPGWTGLAHCNSGWFRVGDWNEFSSPSIMGIVSESPSLAPAPCPGCASPNGMYIADVAQIATDWEFLGVVDMRRDIVVSQTETWISGEGEQSRPGGLATVVGGYNFGSCGELSLCLGGDAAFGDDFGGFTWSGDSSYLYAATSDSIVTIDPEDGSYWERDNDLSCDYTRSPSQFTGVSTPDGSRVIVPCGTSLIILDIDKSGDQDEGFSWLAVCCLLLLIVGLLAYFSGFVGVETNQSATSLLIPILLVMASLSGCTELTIQDLDKDSEELPSSIDLAIQGGVEEGELKVFVSPGEDVPPESIDVLVESSSSHQWFQLGHRSIGQKTGYDLHDQTSFSAGQVCGEGCSQITVKAFYRGQLMSQQEISI